MDERKQVGPRYTVATSPAARATARNLVCIDLSTIVRVIASMSGMCIIVTAPRIRPLIETGQSSDGIICMDFPGYVIK